MWEAYLSDPRYLFRLCHHKDLSVQRGREQMPTPKSKASTNPTLFWLSLCLFIACTGGWAWLFMCVQNEIAISAVLHGGDGMGTGKNRAPCPLLVLYLTWLQNTGQFKKTNKQTLPPPPTPEIVYCMHSRELKGCWYKISVLVFALQLKHSPTLLEVRTGSESLLTYKEFPWPWLF